MTLFELGKRYKVVTTNNRVYTIVINYEDETVFKGLDNYRETIILRKDMIADARSLGKDDK